MTPTAADRRPTEEVRLDANGNPAHDRAKPWANTLRYQDECQLDRLLWAGQIDDRQWLGGIRFRRLWLAAHRVASYGIRYTERVDGGGSGVESDTRLAAEDAVRAALRDLTEAAALAVQAVAGNDERGAGRMPALRLGLDGLAMALGVPAGFRRRAV